MSLTWTTAVGMIISFYSNHNGYLKSEGHTNVFAPLHLWSCLQRSVLHSASHLDVCKRHIAYPPVSHLCWWGTPDNSTASIAPFTQRPRSNAAKKAVIMLTFTYNNAASSSHHADCAANTDLVLALLLLLLLAKRQNNFPLVPRSYLFVPYRRRGGIKGAYVLKPICKPNLKLHKSYWSSIWCSVSLILVVRVCFCFGSRSFINLISKLVSIFKAL